MELLSSQPTLCLAALWLICCGLLVRSDPSDYKTFIYKACTGWPNPRQTQTQTQTLSSLFQDLVAHSSLSSFFKATSLESDVADNTVAFSGRFQCRGDLSLDDCHACVSSIPSILAAACGSSVAAARVQLSGCYVDYVADGFEEAFLNRAGNNGDYLVLGKSCSRAGGSRSGAAEVEALAQLGQDVLEGSGEGVYFYDRVYGGVRVMAQCEEGLDRCDCVECIGEAARVAHECGRSVWGQIYMDSCFVIFTHPADHQGPIGNKNDTGRLGAIIVGVAASVLIGFIFLKFMISRMNKGEY